MVFNDHEVELTRNESKILMLLLQQKNKIVSRDEMMNYLWKTDYYVDENTLSVNVNRLRKKLDSIGCQRFIETVKGMGYKV
ncbi:winged helix-turn-helix domain-containing protein [Faecalicoccus acidiformans]|uniref:winged helix-turn-helix domain-containing protein n=1 Tax=Faecalicoccus acidiformans TaxID=915173 RepID=UPI0032090CAA